MAKIIQCDKSPRSDGIQTVNPQCEDVIRSGQYVRITIEDVNEWEGSYEVCMSCFRSFADYLKTGGISRYNIISFGRMTM